MINRLPLLFTHTTPLNNHNIPIIYIYIYISNLGHSFSCTKFPPTCVARLATIAVDREFHSVFQDCSETLKFLGFQLGFSVSFDLTPMSLNMLNLSHIKSCILSYYFEVYNFLKLLIFPRITRLGIKWTIGD
jgi:hypothetical protein